MSQNPKIAAIYQTLEHFTKSWSGKEDTFDSCVSEEPFIYMNQFPNMYSKEDLRNALRKDKADDLKIRICNHFALTQGNTARQYATIIGLFTRPGAPYMHLAFGGTFTNTLQKDEEGWKLSVIRFNLQFEDSTGECYLSKEGLIWRAPGYGNKSFIRNWKTLDDRIGHNMDGLPNMGLRMISPEYDTPWYAIDRSDVILNEEEKISELLYKYTYAFDLATFHLLSDVFADEIFLKIEDEEFHERRDAIGYLKMLRKSRPRAHNSVKIRSIDIQDDKAFLVADKIAPELVNLSRVGIDFDQWIHGSYELEAARIDERWQITKLSYTKKENRDE